MQERFPDSLVCIVCACLALVCAVFFLQAEEQTVVGVYIFGAVVLVWLGNHYGVVNRLRLAVERREMLWNLCLVVCCLCLFFFFRDDHYCLFLLGTICCYAAAILGLNVQLGYTGVINFSAASFFGVGSYAAALLLRDGLIPPLAAIPAGGVAAGIVGCVLLLPVLRTSGHYSALVTMAFAMLFNVFLEVNETFGGPQGMSVPSLRIFGLDFGTDISWGNFEASFYLRYDLFLLTFLALIFALTRRLERSWMGLCMDAVREDEISAACFGIGIARWKITAFTLGNVIIGMAGALYAMMLGYISPANFTFSDSLLFLSILLLGGMGSIWGVIAATIIVVVIPEKLQSIQEYRYLLYSLLVLLVIVFRPSGLLPRRSRRYIQGGAV